MAAGPQSTARTNGANSLKWTDHNELQRNSAGRLV